MSAEGQERDRLSLADVARRTAVIVLGGIVDVLIAIPLASAGAIAVAELLRSRGVEDLADLAEVITEDGPGAGPAPLSEDDGDVRDVATSSSQEPPQRAA